MGYMVRTLSQGRDEPRKTIVPMILVEIMISLSACVNNRIFLKDASFYYNCGLLNTFINDMK